MIYARFKDSTRKGHNTALAVLCLIKLNTLLGLWLWRTVNAVSINCGKLICCKLFAAATAAASHSLQVTLTGNWSSKQGAPDLADQKRASNY